MDLGPLVAAFEANFLQHEELGASLCIWHEGKPVVNLSGGFCDRDRTIPWTEETPVLIWSATKGLASACLIDAAFKNQIDFNRRVVDFWPEYGQAGKQETTLRHVLSHQAGQPALRDPTISILDYELVIAQLENQQPFWKPGTAHGYHARTFGFLVDEILRRIVPGMTLSRYFHEVFGHPLKLRLWIGVPEVVLPEVAPIFAPRRARLGSLEDPFYESLGHPGSLSRSAFSTPAGLQLASQMNVARIQHHSLPSIGGIGTAKSLAAFYENLFSTGYVVDQISIIQSSGLDEVLRIDTAFGIGYMMDPILKGRKVRNLFGPSEKALGQPGAGGSHAFFDQENRVAFAYVMNQMEPGIFPNEKSLRLMRLFYASCAQR
ncbi:MAG: beta-lactamase family protein [Verrucomicrobia bacterium]|nr:beta-lactamase family protein [Verrucomicrobiota bacterium]